MRIFPSKQVPYENHNITQLVLAWLSDRSIKLLRTQQKKSMRPALQEKKLEKNFLKKIG
jgi:hypothetical protein